MSATGVEIREAAGGAGRSGGVEIPIKVVPNSSRDTIAGILGGMLKIKVAAPPEGGKANRAVCDLIADALGVGKGDVQVVSGKTNPNKRVFVRGLSVHEARGKLGVE